jgi:hypothetical protein
MGETARWGASVARPIPADRPPRADPDDVEVHHLPPRWSPTPPRPRRPVGIAVLAVLIAISGVIVLISGAFLLLNSVAGTIVPADLLIVHAGDSLGDGILLILGAVMLAVASALWNQERWSLWTTIIAVFAGFTYLFFTASITILFVILVVLFVYLLSVRRYFF